MNFLAHLYLSGSNQEILMGNFIADAVKGSSYTSYPKKIQQGILLHRAIDHYTDTHPIVRTSKNRLNKRYNHYSGVIIDILYDHFLAKNWPEYSAIPLDIYAESIYDILSENTSLFPEKIGQMLPYMIEYNWLVNYATVDGIENILKGMNRRTQGVSKMDQAVHDLKKHYTDFENDFTFFFKELSDHCAQKLNEFDP
jgi:acyl carrier protein phosphodiesterase